MTYKTHLSTGFLFSSVIFLLVLNLELTPALIAVLLFSTALGSSAPDLDTPSGELWDKVPAGGILARLVHPIFIGGHRHISHSFLGFGLFILLFKLLLGIISIPIVIQNSELIVLAFAIGYLAHLFADMFTEAGVPLLFPLAYHFGIPPNPFQKIRVKTGKWFENLVIYPLVNVLLVLVIAKYILK